MVETKSKISDFANNLIKLFNFERFMPTLREYITKKYNESVEELEKQIDMNVYVDFHSKARAIEQLNTYTTGLIKGVGEELEKNLRAEIQRGLMNDESREEIRKRIANVLKGNNPTRFKFEDRIRTILRTETTRIQNKAKLDEAKKLGIKLKKYIINPNPMSEICKKMVKKYPKDKAIDLDKDFKVVVNGKTISEPYPPFHPNCRSNIVITRE